MRINMHLAVFGANGPTGRQVVAQALAAGHHVIAVTRKPDEFPLSSLTLWRVPVIESTRF